MKYVVMIRGVMNGRGGVFASSIGVVLKACGLRVTCVKIDPYLNTEAGTISPSERGEVFVLDDGGEVDLDLGAYERFLDINLTRDNNITTGKIYQSVIDKARRGDYWGKTVQVGPHITDAIQEWIERVAKIPVDGKEGPADVCVIELGGTIGDIELIPFIEALVQFSYRVGPGNFCLVYFSPVLNEVGEQETKPTQDSILDLRSYGLTPSIVACRSSKALEKNVIEKFAQFCNIPEANIVTVYNVSNPWHAPLCLRDQKAHEAILRELNLLGSITQVPTLDEWTTRAMICDRLQDPVRIAMVGNYTGTDTSLSYTSVLKALLHASVACRRKLFVHFVPSADLEEATAIESPEAYQNAWNLLRSANGVLVPGGFGDSVQGKYLAAKYARENNVPFFGICLGMQIAVIEYARSVLNLQDANSTEFDLDTKNPCVIFMPEETHMGGSMRLGSRRTYFQSTSCISATLYGNVQHVDERHRHRYEVNPEMVAKLENAGLSFVGKDETGQRMEVLELPSHPYFVGVQFRPEFKSRPARPSSLFLGLIAASCGQLKTLLGNPRVPSRVSVRRPSRVMFRRARQNRTRIMHHQNGSTNQLVSGVHAGGTEQEQDGWALEWIDSFVVFPRGPAQTINR